MANESTDRHLELAAAIAHALALADEVGAWTVGCLLAQAQDTLRGNNAWAAGEVEALLAQVGLD